MKLPPRWVAIAVFVFSSCLNYLDRQLLPALAPAIRADFHWSYQDYGVVVSYFSILYAIAAPIMGLVIDRIGLNAGVTLAVGGWSFATLWTGFSQTLNGLIASRFVLGVAQGGGIPAAGKAMATYLEPRERALGNAMSQNGISLGLILAPLLAGWIEPSFGWRAVFLVAGGLGFLWLPAWWFIAARTERQPIPVGRRSFDVTELLGLRSYWGLVLGTMAVMTVYSLWTNWTTPFFVSRFGLEASVVNRTLAWIPPLVGAAGGVCGGIASMRLVQRGMGTADARRWTALGAAVLLVVCTAGAPFVSTPVVAALLIGISYFCATFISVNLYTLPIDLFGPERAAFGAASLTGAYGAMQALISPWIGRMVDTQGFGPVCLAVALLPLCGVGLLFATRER